MRNEKTAVFGEILSVPVASIAPGNLMFCFQTMLQKSSSSDSDRQ